MEFALKANRESIVWEFISTVDGLSKWMADNVTLDDDVFTFSWGVPWKHQEQRSATIIEQKKLKFIRLKWDDEDDEDDDIYWELAIEHNDITSDMSLIIIDFSEPEELDDQKDLWQNSLRLLRRNSGM